MRNVLPAALAAILLLAAAGCSGPASEAIYQVRDGVSYFQTPDVRFQTEPSPQAATSRVTMTVRASAACPGEDCVPEQIELRFGHGPGHPEWPSFRGVTIEIDGRQTRWEGADMPGSLGHALPPGRFLRLDVGPRFFSQFANGRQVRLRLGQQAITIPYAARAPFREMEAAMNLGPDA